MNDFIGMSLAYRFSPNRKMSRAEQLFLSLWEFWRKANLFIILCHFGWRANL
jgi:hypothetical protein